MKRNFYTIIVLLFMSIISNSQTQCFDFIQYSTVQLSNMANSTPIGGTIAQQGDIKLVKVDTGLNIMSIDSTNNTVFHYDLSGPSIKIDVSASSLTCKKLTFIGYANYETIIDGDTIITASLPFSYSNSNYNLSIDSSGYYRIEGDFNTVYLNQQTHVIGDICLMPCATSSNCFDFTQYSTVQLSNMANAAPIGGTIAQQGDIKLVKVDTGLNIMSIDSTNNTVFHYDLSGPSIKINVSASSLTCKKLTFIGYANYETIIDGDTIIAASLPFSYSNSNYNLSIDTSGYYTIEGDFNTVYLNQQTHVIGDICLDSCSLQSTSVNELKFTKKEIKLYPNPTQSILNIMHEEIDNAHYTIMDLTGKIVKQGILNSKSIDVSSIEKGNYNIRLVDKKLNVYNQLFIKL